MIEPGWIIMAFIVGAAFGACIGFSPRLSRMASQDVEKGIDLDKDLDARKRLFN
jgi:hypothetical protein